MAIDKTAPARIVEFRATCRVTSRYIALYRHGHLPVDRLLLSGKPSTSVRSDKHPAESSPRAHPHSRRNSLLSTNPHECDESSDSQGSAPQQAPS